MTVFYYRLTFPNSTELILKSIYNAETTLKRIDKLDFIRGHRGMYYNPRSFISFYEDTEAGTRIKACAITLPFLFPEEAQAKLASLQAKPS